MLVLNNVSIMVGEFIPFGTNQMLSLNHKLGVTDRVQVCSQGGTALLSRWVGREDSSLRLLMRRVEAPSLKSRQGSQRSLPGSPLPLQPLAFLLLRSGSSMQLPPATQLVPPLPLVPPLLLGRPLPLVLPPATQRKQGMG